MRRLTPLLVLGACGWYEPAATTQALDYTIDRPRVLAMSVTPPVVAPGQPVTVDALVLAPPGQQAGATTLRLCGLREDLPVYVDSLDCFHNEDLVEDLADRTPFAWTPRDLPDIPCERLEEPGGGHGGGEGGDTGGDTGDTGSYLTDYNCVSDVPLLLEVDHGTDVARGYLGVRYMVDPLPPDLEPPPALDGDRGVHVVGEPTPGGEVELRAHIQAATYTGDVKWFVDAGELMRTGRTLATQVDPERFESTNTLRIPADHHGALRVAAVFGTIRRTGWEDGEIPETGNVAWAVTTMEVP